MGGLTSSEFFIAVAGGFLLGLAIVVACLALWWLWWRLPKYQANKLRSVVRDAKSRAELEDTFRKTVTQMLGGIAVLAGTWVAYSQLAEQHRQAVQQDRSARDILVSNQISKSFELLGSDKLMSRIGGIYALENILNSSSEYHFSILESLTAFVRTNGQPGKPVTGDVQAALSVIGRRAPATNDNPDLHGAQLMKANLYLANLDRANLEDADLDFADLRFAMFTNTSMKNARLSRASMDRLDLSGSDLDRANLTGASMKNAVLQRARLAETNVTQAQLDEACGDVSTTLPPGMTLKTCSIQDLPDYSLDPADRE